VKALSLLFFAFRTEVIQNDHLALIRVAGDHEKSLGKRWGNSHAHVSCRTSRGKETPKEIQNSYVNAVSHTSFLIRLFSEGKRAKRGEKSLQQRERGEKRRQSQCYFALDDSLVPFTSICGKRSTASVTMVWEVDVLLREKLSM